MRDIHLDPIEVKVVEQVKVQGHRNPEGKSRHATG